jgi:hypothetical protein
MVAAHVSDALGRESNQDVAAAGSVTPSSPSRFPTAGLTLNDPHHLCQQAEQ